MSQQQPIISGLKNPDRAVRSLGAAAMTLEGLTLLLAIQPIRVLGNGLTATAMWIIVIAAVVAFCLAGLMKRSWAWHAASVLQVGLVIGGIAHWAIAAIGVMFGLAWVYALRVRKRIMHSPHPGFDH